MDKAEFIRLAPAYYELAVLLELQGAGGWVPAFKLERSYQYHPDEAAGPEEVECYIENDALLKVAIENLVSKGAVEALLDPFGPSQYRPGPKLADYMEAARQDMSSPLHKGEASGDSGRWIRDALERLNAVCRRLEVSNADWINRDDDWEPLQIDRNNETFIEADAALDKAIEEIEKSNGYADQSPEERNWALENLRMVSQKFKKAATIAVGYVRTHALNVLGKLADKFTGAAIGEAAKATLKAIGRWLHELMPTLF